MQLRRILANIIVFSRSIYTLSTISLNHDINYNVRNGNLSGARKLFDAYPNSRNTVTWNSLINGYIKTWQIQEAENLFDQMPERDVVSWNTMLSGYRDRGEPLKGYHCFLHMLRHGSRPTELTFAILISTFHGTKCNILIPPLHGSVMVLGHDLQCYLGSALMRGYVGLRDRSSFLGVFDEILVKDIAPWNVLILGFMDFGLTREAKKAFDEMPAKSSYSWSIMVDGYMKNYEINKAIAFFNVLRTKDVVSWTAMIKGCVRCKKYAEAFELFYCMTKSHTRPNHYTFSSILEACAGCSSLAMGSQIHACIVKLGIRLDVVLGTSLVDMYSKCGDIDASFCVFQSIGTKNLVSWNAIIGGYARHGLASRALAEFDRMVKSGLVPDGISFINVLSGLVHRGMVKEGEELFQSMVANYGIKAEMEHYSCMVDLYGRAGQLEKAEDLIKGMPFEPDVVVWGALLGACGLHSCLEVAENVSKGIRKIEEDHPAIYSMLSRICVESGGRIGGIDMEKMIESWRGRKQKAGSWV